MPEAKSHKHGAEADALRRAVFLGTRQRFTHKAYQDQVVTHSLTSKAGRGYSRMPFVAG